MLCEYCNNEHDGSYGSGRFCSKHCARGFSTLTKRKSTRTKAGQTIKKNSILKYEKSPKICCICEKPIPYEHRKRKTCSNECKNKLHKQQFSNMSVLGGLASAKSQQKRSKNEIDFYNKCEEYFGKENVLHNKPMFNGWDADIILPQYKLAILWNGPWHYRKVTKDHNLSQVQNRDKLKINEIRKCGYIAYIIKDTGKYNIVKVENEFKLLLKYLNI